MPISFFEIKGQVFFNRLAVIAADGRVLGIYRTGHRGPVPASAIATRQA